jgi:aldehyde:ferredoxin oxidoreductase
MDDDRFLVRVRTATRAAWSTALVLILWMTAAWCAWRTMMASESLRAFVSVMWGGEFSAEEMKTIGIYFFGAFKLGIFAVIAAAFFLWFWSRALRRAKKVD